MPTTYTDQFYVMDPGNRPPSGTQLTVEKFDFVDQNDNGFISPFGNDSFDGLDITSVWDGDTVTVRLDDNSVQTISGVTFYTNGGPAVFTPTDGTVLQDATFLTSTFVNQSTFMPVGAFGPPCFTAGTLIDTPGGARRIETLVAGDLVLTRDHGPRPVRWIGQRTVPGQGAFAPVRIAPGALGNDRALSVSQQHRLLLGGWRCELLFGADEVLAAAVHLVDGTGIALAPCAEVSYLHLLFDRHEIVTSNGIASESLHPGAHMMRGDRALRAEVTALFPDLATPAGAARWRAARPVLRRRDAALLRDAPLPAMAFPVPEVSRRAA